MKNSKKRLFEMMGKVNPSFKKRLNEDVFNDVGEPNMKHQQVDDYTEPSEHEYNDESGYEVEQTSESIVSEIEKHFNTKLETYDNETFNFLTKGLVNEDLMFVIENNLVSGYAPNNDNFPETNIEDLDIKELIQFFESYQQYIVSGEEANIMMNNNQKSNAVDREYSAQERGFH